MKYVGIFILGFVVHHVAGPLGMIVAIGAAAWWMSSNRKKGGY